MSQTLYLHQVTDRLDRLEQLLKAVREELAELRQQVEPTLDPQTDQVQVTVAYPWIDKALQRRWMKELCDTLSIQGQPIGAEAFQQQMSQAGLTYNELSQSLIEARET